MAELIIISWRDIPSQVVIKHGRTRSKVLLSKRFQEAIDRAAMRAGKTSSHDYINDWKRNTQPMDGAGDLEFKVQQIAKQIEADYTDKDLLALIRNQGLRKINTAP